MGVGTATFRRALAAQAAKAGTVTPEMIRAGRVDRRAGTDRQGARERPPRDSSEASNSFEALRKVEVGYDVPPALSFNPAPGLKPAADVKRNQAATRSQRPPVKRPSSDEELAFLPVTELAGLIRSRQVTSTELTKLYLGRLKRFDPLLKCVVTLTEELALKQAAAADAEIAVGQVSRSAPWHSLGGQGPDRLSRLSDHLGGAAVQGSRAQREGHRRRPARRGRRGARGQALAGGAGDGRPVVRRQDAQPLGPARGSSGSSAGSASAVAAGLVGFAIGSETLGSIVSPCRACGASGLRPTFGRVSRHGCMSLAWSMDKIGPIARSVEDCALVFDAIHGHDGLDPTAVDQPFAWPPSVDLANLKIGYIEEPSRPLETRRRAARPARAGLRAGPDLACRRSYPLEAITLMLDTEAAAVFDELTRHHVTEGLNRWPGIFREGAVHPGRRVPSRRAGADPAHAGPWRGSWRPSTSTSASGPDLVITNLTGHPSVVFPGSLHDIDGRPGPGRSPSPAGFTASPPAGGRPRLPAGDRPPSAAPAASGSSWRKTPGPRMQVTIQATPRSGQRAAGGRRRRSPGCRTASARGPCRGPATSKQPVVRQLLVLDATGPS